MKKEEYTSFQKDIINKMDLLVKIAAHSTINPQFSQTESILHLKKIGLKPKQISEILNTTQNYVNMTLSKSKKSKGNKKRHGKKEKR